MSIGFVYHPRENINSRIVGKGGTDIVWLTPQTDKLEHTFYVLDIYNTLLLHPNYITNIPEDVLQKLCTGEWHLLIDCIEEYDIYKLGTYKNSKWPLQQHMIMNTGLGRLVNFCNFLWDNYKIPHNHVHYSSSFLYDKKMLSKLKDMNVTTDINFHFRDVFLTIYSKNTINVSQSRNEKYLYSALNAGDPKAPKVDMIYQLWKNDLLGDGLVSLSNLKKYIPKMCQKEFIELLPIRSNFTNKHWWLTSEDRQKSELKELQDVRIYISTETLAPNNYCFITEKTYRSIAYKKPFIIVGNKSSLQKLRDLGFETFDKWWSEEYDTLDWSERIDWTIKFLKWMKKTKPIFNGIEKVTEHNYDHMMNTKWQEMFKTSLVNAKKQLTKHRKML